jgi:hypothetical protein
MRIGFPFKGYHKGFATQNQPEGTSPHLLNVRPYDSLDDRARGGKRPASVKWSTTQVCDVASPIVEIVSITVVDSAASATEEEPAE